MSSFVSFKLILSSPFSSTLCFIHQISFTFVMWKIAALSPLISIRIFFHISHQRLGVLIHRPLYYLLCFSLSALSTTEFPFIILRHYPFFRGFQIPIEFSDKRRCGGRSRMKNAQRNNRWSAFIELCMAILVVSQFILASKQQ